MRTMPANARLCPALAHGLAAGLIVAPILTVTSQADPLTDWFLRSCNRAGPAAEAHPDPEWLEICERDAASRAIEFRAANPRQRILMLTEDCRNWFAQNNWQFSKR